MRFIKDIYILFCVSALSALVSFVTGIWIRNILGPEDYGVWLIYSLILVYGYRMHLGILDGFSRDIPQLLGKKNLKRVKLVRNVVFTWMIISGSLAIPGVIIVFLLPLSDFETILSILVILLVPLQNFALFYNMLFLSIQNFKVVAIIQLFIGSLQYLFMAIFSIEFGIYGLLLGVLAGNLIAILYSQMRLTFKLKVNWDWKVIKQMIAYGIPITLIGILLNVFITIDRLIIFYFFGPSSVGHYGITAFVYQGIMVLPSVLHQVMYPKISFRYGETGEKKALKNIVVNPTIYLSYLSPFILGIVYLILPVLVEWLMPQYTAGIEAAKFIIIGMFFLIWAMLYAHYLTVVNKQWTYLRILFAAVIINTSVNLTLVYLGFDIEGVALGTAFSYVIYPLLMMWFCFKDMGETYKMYIQSAGLIFLPFITMISLLFMIHHLHLYVVISLVIFLTVYGLCLFVFSYHISFLRLYRNELIERVKRRFIH